MASLSLPPSRLGHGRQLSGHRRSLGGNIDISTIEHLRSSPARSPSRPIRRQSPSLPQFSFPQAPEPPLAKSLPAFSFPQAPAPATAPVPAPERAPVRSPSAPLPEFSFPQAPVPTPAPAAPSPTTLAPPPPPGPSPSPGRRGHVHRRSAAMSGADLTFIKTAVPPPPPPPTLPTASGVSGSTDRMRSESCPFPSVASHDSAPSTDQTPHPPSPRLIVTEATPNPQPPSPQPNPVRSSSPDSTARPKTAGSLRPRDPAAISHRRPLSTPGSAAREAAPRLPAGPSLPSHVPETDVKSSSELQQAAEPTKPAQKHKKSKSRPWAGLLSRKSKKAQEPPVSEPPKPAADPDRDNDSIEVDFDNDNVLVLRNPNSPDEPDVLEPASLNAAWKPKSFYEQSSQLGSGLLLDLDAALDPLNSASATSESSPGTPFSLATKRMYSGGRRGEFVGPEMRYHRRAESAPEMPPFDQPGLVGRRGAPDVFYEEDEDEFLAGNEDYQTAATSSSDTVTRRRGASNGTASDVPGLGVQIVDSAEPPPKQESPLVLPESAPPGEQNTSADDTSTAKGLPRMSSGDEESRRPLTSPEPSKPSPDPTAGVSPGASSASFDVGRLATPSSSLTDHRTFGSTSTNPTTEGPGSSEDIPSLTSASTMTGNPPRLSGAFPRRVPGERSVSYTPPRRTRMNQEKRSSIVSLSRLMGATTANEHSKLRYEAKPEDEPERVTKKKKRISSRLMFWKPRDKEKDKDKAGR